MSDVNSKGTTALIIMREVRKHRPHCPEIALCMANSPHVVLKRRLDSISKAPPQSTWPIVGIFGQVPAPPLALTFSPQRR
jgi:hypothetical protein